MLENEQAPVENETEITVQRKTSKGLKLGLALVAASALGFNIYLVSKIDHIGEASTAERTALEERIRSLEEELAATQGRTVRSADAIRAELDQARKQAYSTARNEARRQSDRLAKQMEEKQREQQEMFLTRIGSLAGTTDTNATEIGDVRHSVDGVRSDVEQTRGDLAETADRLLAAEGAMEDVDGRVGANAARIQEIIRQGERDVTNFTLVKSKDRSRVEDVQIRLKDVNQRKNRFSLEILADDQLIQQKDKYVSEPVEFYVTGATRPYEVVVTQVAKDRIEGYLVRPKIVEMARR